jgi:hypothetical protein
MYAWMQKQDACDYSDPVDTGWKYGDSLFSVYHIYRLNEPDLQSVLFFDVLYLPYCHICGDYGTALCSDNSHSVPPVPGIVFRYSSDTRYGSSVRRNIDAHYSSSIRDDNILRSNSIHYNSNMVCHNSRDNHIQLLSRLLLLPYRLQMPVPPAYIRLKAARKVLRLPASMLHIAFSILSVSYMKYNIKMCKDCGYIDKTEQRDLKNPLYFMHLSGLCEYNTSEIKKRGICI